MADLDLTNFQGFLDYEGLEYYDDKSETRTDEKIAVETERATNAEKTLTTNLNTHTSNKSNPHGVTKSQVGLGNVDNTSDVNKPISTATQTALDKKANIASPTLTGTPKAPTASAGTNTTQIATTAFVQTEIGNLINGAPETANTLKELSDLVEQHKDVTDALDAAIGKKVDKVDGKGLSTNDFTTAEKNKLSGIEEGANAYTHPSYTARTGIPTASQTPAFGGTFSVNQIKSDATGHVTAATSRTITIPSTLSNGSGTVGLIKTTSEVTSSSGYTACPVISGVPYYKPSTYTHPTSGVTAGTYRSVTVDANGHVTEGSNPTTTVAQGGTGKTTLTSGYALIGNGTNAVSLRAITATPSNGSTSLFTAGGAYTQLATKLNTSSVVTSLSSTSDTDALAASSGKNLQDQITVLNSDLTSIGRRDRLAQTDGSFEVGKSFTVILDNDISNYRRIIVEMCYSSLRTLIEYESSIIQGFITNNLVCRQGVFINDSKKGYLELIASESTTTSLKFTNGVQDLLTGFIVYGVK